MVPGQTMGLNPPLSFMTAPPDVERIAHTRFREPRNLPHRNAPAHKASLYYWWWALLRQNPNYQRTCQDNGHGPLSSLYADFGDVFNVGFVTWWDKHQSLFAEKTALVQPGDPPPESDQVLYLIDPHKPFNQIHSVLTPRSSLSFR
jgi:hypothetical protein